MKIFLWLLFIMGGFISGSMMYCKIIPKLLLNKDICELSDDGNPGAFNVFAHCGKKMGIPCVLLDIFKGLVPVLLASFFVDTRSWLFLLVVIAPVLGHAIGLFNRFRGGKCISVSGGVVIGLLPVTWIPFVVFAGTYIILSTIIKINPNRIRSIVVFSIFGIVVFVILIILGQLPTATGCMVMALIAIAKHLKPTDDVANNKVTEDISPNDCYGGSKTD